MLNNSLSLKVARVSGPLLILVILCGTAAAASPASSRQATTHPGALWYVGYTDESAVTYCVRYVYGVRGNAGYFHNSCGFYVDVTYWDQGSCSTGCGDLVAPYANSAADVNGHLTYGACRNRDVLIKQGAGFICRYGA